MSGNGWLSSVLYIAVTEFNIDLDYVLWKLPLTKLMLLIRQHIFVNDKNSGIDLYVQEDIDNGIIDQKLKEKSKITIINNNKR